MTIRIISDLHLQTEKPEITTGLKEFLTHLPTDCKSLFILGDLFEYWVGDDVPSSLSTQISTLLKETHNRGVRIYFQAGNRDFLLGDAWLKASGVELLPEAFKLNLPDGKATLLMHGDQLCTDDVEYQALRKQLRDNNWQRQFLQKSPQERIQLAQALRQESQQRTAGKTHEIMDVNPDTVTQCMLKAQVTRLIHGHTHRPAIHDFELDGTAMQRFVLGDWGDQGWYIQADATGTYLHAYFW